MNSSKTLPESQNGVIRGTSNGMQIDLPTRNWVGISLESWLTIAAVVLGPILALYAQRLLDNRRAKHDRQLRVFRELMITRTQRLSPRHVEALNAVPLEFENRGKGRKVIQKWKVYLEHLGTDSSKDANAWMTTGTNLLVDMLYEMAGAVGFNTDKIQIGNEIYLPQLFNTIEAEQTTLRKQLLEVLNGTGTRKIPIAVFETRFPDLIDQPKSQVSTVPSAGSNDKETKQ